MVIDRMAINLRDGADSRPAGMGQGRFATRFRGGKDLKDPVVFNGLPKFADVSAQLSNDGKGFVSECDAGAAGVPVFRNKNGFIEQIGLSGAAGVFFSKPALINLFYGVLQVPAVFK